MISKKMTVKNENGLGARLVAVFVQIACQHESKVFVEYEDKKVNAKSIMGMMTLSLRTGEELVVSADGADEETAIQDIENFLSGTTEG